MRSIRVIHYNTRSNATAVATPHQSLTRQLSPCGSGTGNFRSILKLFISIKFPRALPKQSSKVLCLTLCAPGASFTTASPLRYLEGKPLKPPTPGEVSEAFRLVYFLSRFIVNASRASYEAPFIQLKRGGEGFSRLQTARAV